MFRGDFMRKIVYGLICVVLFLAACSVQVQNDYSNFEFVELYNAMSSGQVVQKDTLYSESDGMMDLVSNECPEKLPDKFRRVVLEGTGSSLVFYTDAKGDELYCSLFKPDEEDIQYRPANETPEEGVVVVVNGVNVYLESVQRELDALSQSVPRDENALGQAINRAINNELIRQESLEMVVSEQDLEESRERVLGTLGLTEESLSTQIEDGVVDSEVFSSLVEEQARINKLLQERVLIGNIDVEDEQLQEFYMNNPNQFLRAESAVMRQILVSSSGRTAEQLQSRAQAVANFLQNNDFCETVNRFSDLEEGKNSCGTFVVPRGILQPDLEYSAFNTAENQTAVVQTDAGIHFVQTLQVVPAQMVPYSQAATQLEETLVNSVLQQRLAMYFLMLRGEADIVAYTV